MIYIPLPPIASICVYPRDATNANISLSKT